ncbi:MAG: hypothetical protein DSY87_05340 [Methylococcus sp.]|nr:MAG: hypothetical protein DSY87_05340 [Methylococcus sp.]
METGWSSVRQSLLSVFHELGTLDGYTAIVRVLGGRPTTHGLQPIIIDGSRIVSSSLFRVSRMKLDRV